MIVVPLNGSYYEGDDVVPYKSMNRINEALITSINVPGIPKDDARLLPEHVSLVYKGYNPAVQIEYMPRDENMWLQCQGAHLKQGLLQGSPFEPAFVNTIAF